MRLAGIAALPQGSGDNVYDSVVLETYWRMDARVHSEAPAVNLEVQN